MIIWITYIISSILTFLITRDSIKDDIKSVGVELSQIIVMFLCILLPFINTFICIWFLIIYLKENSTKIAKIIFFIKDSKDD